jgi:cell division protease FtsH
MSQKPRTPGRTLVLWLLLIFAFVGVYQAFQPGGPRSQPVGYSEFMTEAESGALKEVKIDRTQGTLTGIRKDDTRVSSMYEGDNVAERLRAAGVRVTVVATEQSGFMQIIVMLLPTLLLIGLFIFLMRGMRNGPGNMASSFGGSKAKRSDPQKVTTRFKDVLGADEAVEEVRDLVEYLRNPGRFQRLGGKVPKGVLLMGAPGTGKTLLARAMAGEAGVPFFSISGSDFVEMFVGVGASRVRGMMEEARKNSPCVIFIDEIDAVGRHRGGGLGGGHDEREQTLNQLLVEMDGFEGHGVLMIAATNRPDVLDPALLRPGRFDRRVVMPTPDLTGRKALLRHYTGSIPIEPDVDLDAIAALTHGATGADLANLVNEASLRASKADCPAIRMEDFSEAFDKIVLGPERKTLVMREADKRRTAIHEAGHTLVSLKTGAADLLYKVTVIPRGRALGVTWSLPRGDAVSKTESELRDEVKILLGGRAAEKLVYKGDLSTGGSNDIERATEIERDMVTRYGMDEELGPMAYGKDAGQIFLGRDFTAKKDHSDLTDREIDLRVRKRLKDNEKLVDAWLKEDEARLLILADALYLRETLTRAEIDELFAAPPEADPPS